MQQQQNQIGQRNSIYNSPNNHNEQMNIDPVDGRDNKNKNVSRDASGQRQPFGSGLFGSNQINQSFTGMNFSSLV